MAGKIHNIKIINSPSNSNLEVAAAGNLVVKLHSPYSDSNVTVKINPNLIEYEDKIGNNVRQYAVSVNMEDTKTLMFDFKKNNIHKINLKNKNYEIKLMNIGKISEQGQDFRTFEFMITEL